MFAAIMQKGKTRSFAETVPQIKGKKPGRTLDTRRYSYMEMVSGGMLYEFTNLCYSRYVLSRQNDDRR